MSYSERAHWRAGLDGLGTWYLDDIGHDFPN